MFATRLPLTVSLQITNDSLSQVSYFTTFTEPYALLTSTPPFWILTVS